MNRKEFYKNKKKGGAAGEKGEKVITFQWEKDNEAICRLIIQLEIVDFCFY